MTQIIAAGGVVLTVVAGLVIANLLHDRGVNSSISRCLSAVVGGVAFLEAVLWLDVRTAVGVTGALTLAIIVLRLGFHRGLRGSNGRRQDQAWAEVTYAVSGTDSLAIGWGLAGDRWLAFLPIAFMAWGDNAAGLTRATIWRDHPASIWPSVAMLGACLALATLLHTFWIGAVGAVLATAVERYRPRILRFAKIIRFCDDNPVIVGTSLAVMMTLSRVF